MTVEDLKALHERHKVVYNHNSLTAYPYETQALFLYHREQLRKLIYELDFETETEDINATIEANMTFIQTMQGEVDNP